MAVKKLFALLVSAGGDTLEDLKALLKSQAIELCTAQTCEKVAMLLRQTHPELVFTDTKFSDGTWADIIALTERESVPTNVIVVGRNQDTELYLSTMDRGASDFILPPFEAKPVAHVVRVAAEDIRRRRQEQALKAVA